MQKKSFDKIQYYFMIKNKNETFKLGIDVNFSIR